MKRTMLAILILSAVWVAFLILTYVGIDRLGDTTYNLCFDNAGKWYTMESAR